MILFSTVLKTKETFTPEEFARTILEWNTSIPHEENRIGGICWKGDWNAGFGEEGRSLQFAHLPKERIYAARYEKRADDGAVWDTDYIADFAAHTVSVRLERSYLENSPIFQEDFSTPYYIKTLITGGYLEADGDLSVDYRPRIVTGEDRELLLGILKGRIWYALPIVYITRLPDGELPVDAVLLAHKLKGAAHVLVEDTRALSREICENYGSKYEHDGQIGLYFLQSRSERLHRYMKCRYFRDKDGTFIDQIVEAVTRQALIRLPERLHTWQGVNSEILQQSLSEQKRMRSLAEAEKEKAQSESDEMLESLEDDFDRMERQIRELTNTNNALTAENEGLRERCRRQERPPILYSGDEREFYPDEIRDLLLSILTDCRKTVGDETRRAHVIDDLLEANEYRRLSEKRAEKIKVLLSGYKSMNGALRQALTDFGFQISEDGSHYKLTYYGDPRYLFVIAKTGSDYRGGRNDAALISRTVL
ncbi:MAG: hypothetical protein IKS07_11145 [Lachnospiraceae bacterium]|nr:hypothetical protein [Lachnospiraceae bacterium]